MAEIMQVHPYTFIRFITVAQSKRVLRHMQTMNTKQLEKSVHIVQADLGMYILLVHYSFKVLLESL